MPESIIIQVGQCGNQIGQKFWEKAVTEHASYNKNQIFDESFSTFFRNVDSRNGISNISFEKKEKIVELRGRGILVDMEEGVINQIKNSFVGELFDNNQIISSNSGSGKDKNKNNRNKVLNFLTGNNWAVGYNVYGKEFNDLIIETVRKQTEYCDGLQSFFLISSLGGGTGSGLGSYINELLCTEYPEVFKFSSVIFPAKNDDVITSPYNSVLALNKLINHVDCVLPIENNSLLDIFEKIEKSNPDFSQSSLATNVEELKKNKKLKNFDGMNNIVANLLNNLTSSMRFEGKMNVDINDITTNLVPFPRLKFLLSSMTPLYTLKDVRVAPRSIDQMFLDAFTKETQLIKTDGKSGTYLACALIVRGQGIALSDIRRNIDKISKSLKFVSWNQESWKTG
ncbi:Tubulin epsilon chain [Clydaea vesicula]|uniref:Tubulin epsilon chain n=1 Tax=Clydaea vesicula TaxID=447962 RepID=A0AAD5U5P2_9FUNG|nr:Tubulin epsilon chain [Clydaea vesicula]